MAARSSSRTTIPACARPSACPRPLRPQRGDGWAPSSPHATKSGAGRALRSASAPRPRTGGLQPFLDGIDDEELRGRLRSLLAPKSLAARLVEAVLGHSPFLARIVASRPAWLAEALTEEPSQHLDRVIEAMRLACH